jgi:hypothetical protein
MRTEQHGNLFAKLNNVNLSDDAVRDEKRMDSRSGEFPGNLFGRRSANAASPLASDRCCHRMASSASIVEDHRDRHRNQLTLFTFVNLVRD